MHNSQRAKASKSADDFNPTAHHDILNYLKRLWNGEPPDPTFERKPLNGELLLNSLNLVELIFAVATERKVSQARIDHFLRTGISGGGDQKLATLIERITILAEQFDETERMALLSSGVVGDQQELGPLNPPFDSVQAIVKLCRVIVSLNQLQDHDAIDAEFGWVEENSHDNRIKIRLARKIHPEFDPQRTEELLGILASGTAEWNRWRGEHPDEYIDLRNVSLLDSGISLEEANLSQANLSESNLAGVDLRKADLSAVYAVNTNFQGTHLEQANLQGAYCSGSDFSVADLTGADLRLAELSDTHFLLTNLDGANLRKASLASALIFDGTFVGAVLAQANLQDASLRGSDFSKADLRGASLNGASLVEANLDYANMDGCRVFGTSVWKSNLEGTIQSNLVITPEDEAEITLDNLKLAQFVYLILNNSEIRDAIDTMTSKVVLILGRFTTERKAVLDKLRRSLRQRGYIPILFDFEKPSNRDLTETIMTLAGMARFVIADLSDPHSIPHELMTFGEKFLSVPIQAIFCPVPEHKWEYPMFEHLARYPHVLPIYRYDTQEQLMANLNEKVIDPAEAKVEAMKPRKLQ